MTAVRKNRYVITQQDFDKGYKTVVKRSQKDYNFYKWINDVIKIKKNIYNKLDVIKIINV